MRRLRTRRPPSSSARRSADAIIALVSLFAALTWPIFVYIFSPSYTPNTGNAMADQKIRLMKEYAHKLNDKAKEEASIIRSRMKKLLRAELHDIVGYGPHLPRIAVVIVGTSAEAVAHSVESVFSSTDRNRILTVVAVLDGVAKDSTIEGRFQDIDEGRTKHSHGLLSHVYILKPDKDHGKKLHLVFQNLPLGIGASRRIGVDFVNLLVKEHIDHGLKDKSEDIILLMLRSDTTLVDKNWINPVTAALISPPPSSEEETPQKKAANAVSLAVDFIDAEGNVIKSKEGSVVSFGLDAQFEWKTYSDGNIEFLDSYPTPAVLGSATAMRLDVFNNLPARDNGLRSQFSADMELSLNLWLCGDGVDVLPAARVVVNPSLIPTGQSLITEDELARIGASWLDKAYQAQFFQASSNREALFRAAEKAKDSETLPEKLLNKCRSFRWYAEEVNHDVLVAEEPKSADESSSVLDVNARAHDSKDKADLKVDAKQYLTEEQMKTVKSAKMQSIVYEDFSNGHKEHPHMGAVDENGTWGYVHDASALHKNPPAFQPPADKSVACRKDDHYKMLTEKVKVDFEGHSAAERSAKRRVKVFCVAYTTEKNHDRINTLREAWGQKCDGFMVASTKTDKSLGTVNIVHQGQEAYENIWQKVRAIWAYVYDNYYNEYDWFHIGGDDLYLIVENLRLYLESDVIRSAANGGKEPLKDWEEKFQTPLFLGRRFAEQGNMDRIFNSGGSGYTINRAALKTLVHRFPQCSPNYETFAEDVMVAECFRKQGIFPFETRDELGGERYMPFLPGHHLTYRPPLAKGKDWYPKYTIGELKVGLDHCSKYSVAFHYATPDVIRRMHSILYGYC